MRGMSEKIWFCKIGGPADALPNGADAPMREVVSKSFAAITGHPPEFIFSGWGGELTEPERAVVENREPSEEYRKQWHALRSQEEQPVAWMYDVANDGFNDITQRRSIVNQWPDKSKIVPLYTRPPTAAQIVEICAKVVEPNGPRPCDCESCNCGNYDDAQRVAAWDEAKDNADRIRALSPATQGRTE